MMYIACARELKRMDGITRSPMYNIFSECVSNLITIRAYKYEDFFVSKFEKQININTRVAFDLAIIDRLFGIMLEFLIMTQTLFITMAVIFLRNQMTPNIAALCVVYASSFAGQFQFLVRLTAELETLLTAVERLHAFSSIEQEAEYKDDEDMEIDKNWPSVGKIVINNLRLKYRDDLPFG